jgi:hypothetical protein
VGRGAGLLGQGGDLEDAAGAAFEHLERLLLRAGVELHQQVDDDALLLVLVEAHA